ncbi:hypothetical protein V5799_017033 [Amblyomma americanum]|uniref:Secreted protein n=1 Tax=Amblyomma americanum TaxID=6943 RepID=A0AAQ4F3E4_AMBAM
MFLHLAILMLLLTTASGHYKRWRIHREYQIQKHCLRLCTLTLSPAVYCGSKCSCFMLGRFFGICIDPRRPFPKHLVGSHYHLFSRY